MSINYIDLQSNCFTHLKESKSKIQMERRGERATKHSIFLSKNFYLKK